MNLWSFCLSCLCVMFASPCHLSTYMSVNCVFECAFVYLVALKEFISGRDATENMHHLHWLPVGVI